MDNRHSRLGEWLIPMVGVCDSRHAVVHSTIHNLCDVDCVHGVGCEVSEDLEMNDDNDEIMELIQARLDIGRERYGHGIRVNDDTRSWGTPSDSWAEMGLEEVLDLAIYLAAATIRIRQADLVRHDSPPVKKVGVIGRAIAWIRNRF